MVLIFGIVAFADQGHHHGTLTKARKGDPLIVCPVLGEKVPKSKAIPVVYKNKRYYLCCKMCVAPFKKNPEKFIKKAAKYADPVEPAPAKAVYSCPMHPEVVSNKPGICPKCNMKLELRTHQKAPPHSDHSGPPH